ncbi:MAG: hypothetical protein R2820_12750 [Cyclobacteriaceae bacterium]|nr:hypothetical protein [Cyclobacteriaceae bacterium]
MTQARGNSFFFKAGLVVRFVQAILQINKFNNTTSSYHRFAKKRLNEQLTPFNALIEAKLPWNAKEKMQWYVAEFLFVGESFSKLLDVPFTQHIKETYFRCGVLVALCDLIIDDVELSDEEIKELKKPLDLNNSRNEVQQLYTEVYRAFFASMPDERNNEVAHYYEKLFDAQVMSKRQFDPNISKEEVDLVCREKCGYNFLLLRAIVGDEISAKERETWYEVGALVQFCNDAQDMHKDLQKGMRTFASVRPGIDTIVRDLDRQRKIAFALVTKTPFEEDRKDEFLFSLFVMYTAILAKLNIFSNLCGGDFSLERFRSLDKQRVRRSVSPSRLLKLMLPLVSQYQFDKIEGISFEFKANRFSIDRSTRN